MSAPTSAYEPLFTSWSRSLRARNRSDRTITSYLESGRQFVTFLESEGRSTDPRNATRADVEDFVVKLLDTRSANTARIRFASLPAVLQVGHRRGRGRRRPHGRDGATDVADPARPGVHRHRVEGAARDV